MTLLDSSSSDPRDGSDEEDTTTCTRCGEPCSLKSDGCVFDGIWHCDPCAVECSDCGRYESQEREPYDD